MRYSQWFKKELSRDVLIQENRLIMSFLSLSMSQLNLSAQFISLIFIRFILALLLLRINRLL